MWTGNGVEKELIFIRHGMTRGNEEKRYIGVTDEPLSILGKKKLEEIRYPGAESVYTSPLQRCVQTAGLIYPGIKAEQVEGFRECDFGLFEDKNFEELKSEPAYQKWLDSGGTIAFPGGEDPMTFRQRCCRAFREIVEREESQSICFVVHGGTIMSILEAYGWPARDFYEWQVKNGQGYSSVWRENKIVVKEKIE